MRSYPLLVSVFAVMLFLILLAWLFPTPAVIGFVIFFGSALIILQTVMILKDKV